MSDPTVPQAEADALYAEVNEQLEAWSDNRVAVASQVEIPPREITDNLSDPDARSILADWHEQRGIPLTFAGLDAAAAAAAADDAADAAADDADDAAAGPFPLEDPLEPGLYLLRVRGGWYGRGVTRIGWLTPYRGDWWHLVGGRSLRRINADMTTLGELALSGPTRNHKVMGVEATAVVHVMIDLLNRYPTNPKLWAHMCPRPEGWA